MLKRDFKLSDYDLQYTLDVAYEMSYPDGYCTCKDDYCRCTVINESDVQVDTSKLNAKALLDLFIENETQYERESKISETLEGSDINLYGIGRIISINRLYDRDSYTADVSWGYYGQEFDGIQLDRNIADRVQEQVEFLLQMDTIKEKIEYLLCLEYDHLLDDLHGKSWKVVEVSKDDIAVPNAQHYKNVPMLDFYNDSNYTDIRCVIRETGTKVGKPYKLTDGYHRLKNTKNKTVKCLLAY